ncbi:MAG TPA: winged helix-turn-helix domain-containing protein [Luteimonas sp.]|nr:winged helix-turn-helix domain-containing protein [Luteimonas sp.]
MNAVRYRFGEYSLDLAKRELQRDGQPVVLPARVLECLAALIEHRDRAMHRDELVRAVFGRADVSDAQLGQIVLRTRRVIGDDGHEQRYIRTVPRYGFAWVAPVSVDEPEEAAPVAADIGDEVGDTSPAQAPVVPAAEEKQRFGWAGSLAATLVAMALIAWPVVRLDKTERAQAPAQTAERAFMVLPMQASGPGDIAWTRLGLMDFVADRMRRAGLPVLSSEATLGAIADQDRAGAPLRTEARVSGRAQFRDGRWQVDLESVDAHDTSLHGRAEHADLIGATRLATDRLLAALGHSLPAGDHDSPALAERLLRVQSALLANELDTARRILNEAPELQRDQPQLRYRLAQVDFRAGDYSGALVTVDRLLAESKPASDPLFHARLLNARGALLVRLGRFGDGGRSFDESVTLLQGTPYAAELGQALTGRAVTHSAQGRFEQALADLGQARIHQVRAGDALAVARVDANLGAVEMDRGRPSAALGYYRASGPVFESVGALNELAGTRWSLVDAQLSLLDNKAALAESERLFALLGRIRDPAVRAKTLLSRSEALMAVGRMREARELMLRDDAAVPIPAEPHLRDYLMIELARRSGDPRSAALLAERALRAWPAGNDGPLREWAQLRWLQATQAADLPRPDVGLSPVGADTLPGLLIRAMQQGAHGDPALAEQEFASALVLAERSGVPAEIAEAVSLQASWLLDQRRNDEAASLIGRVAPWAAQDFDLALLQLRLFQQSGQAAPWRNALAQARGLAGERAIPAGMELVPGAQAPSQVSEKQREAKL